MWPFQKRPKAGPKGTGRIFEVMRWTFWDDPFYPGLIRDEFNLAKAALTEKEVGDFSIAKGLANQVSGKGERNKEAMAEVERHRRKISAYLDEEFGRADPWLIRAWDAESARDRDEGLEFLMAYIDILRYWGYRCESREAVDPAGGRTMAIISMRSPELTLISRFSERQMGARNPQGEAWLFHCVHRDDVLKVTGLPTDFTVELRGARWTFNSKGSDIRVDKV